MSDWAEINAESERAIEEAIAEAAAHAPNCTCGAVDVVGASHLDWCEVDDA